MEERRVITALRPVYSIAGQRYFLELPLTGPPRQQGTAMLATNQCALNSQTAAKRPKSS